MQKLIGGMDQSRTFNFVPQPIIDDLIKNRDWEIRVTAIDQLHQIIRNMKDVNIIKEALPNFLDFIMVFSSDPNFKISLHSVLITKEIILKIRKEIKPYINNIVSKLYGKLGDNKIMVRQATIDVFKILMRFSSPMEILNLFRQYLSHNNCHIREEIVSIHNLALLLAGRERGVKDISDIEDKRNLFLYFTNCLTDEIMRVRALALEGIALLFARMESRDINDFINNKAAVSDTIRKCIMNRCRIKHLPSFNIEGYIDYEISPSGHEERPGSMELRMVRNNLMSSGKIPWSIPVPYGRRQTPNGTSPILPHLPTALNRDPKPITANISCGINSDAIKIISRTITEKEKEMENSAYVSRRRRNFSLYNDDSPNLINENVTGSAKIDVDQSEYGQEVNSAFRRIEKLVKEKTTIEFSPKINKSLCPAKNETLAILKRRQRAARRTQSANAILQRNYSIKIADSVLPNSISFLEESIRCGDVFKEHGRRAIRDIKQSNITEDNSGLGKGNEVNSLLNQSCAKPLKRNQSWSPKKLADKNNNVPACELGNGTNPEASMAAIQESKYSDSPKDKVGRTAIDELSFENLMPFIDPETVFQAVLQRLSTASRAKRKELDWQDQYEALNDSRRLIKHHSQIIKKNLRDFVLVLLPAVESLRSSTSKNAIILLQEMFLNLKKDMDKELEEVIPVLLKKAAEFSNTGRDNFLTSQADKALTTMISNVTQSKVIQVLLIHTNHKSMNMRSKVAAHLCDALECLASQQSPSGHALIVEKLFKTAVEYLDEGSQLTRTYSKRIIWRLKSWLNIKEVFNRLLSHIDTDMKRVRVIEIIESGPVILPSPPLPPPPPPPPINSTKQKSGQFNGSGLSPHTPTQSHPSRVPPLINSDLLAHSSLAAESNVPHREPKCGRRMSKQSALLNKRTSNLQQLSQKSSMTSKADINAKLQEWSEKLNSRDWKERMDALKQIQQYPQIFKDLSDSPVLDVVDKITARLSDGNTKVLTMALETYACLFHNNGNSLASCLTAILPPLSSSLGSSNEKTKNKALEVLEQITSKIDHISLIQSFSICAGQRNIRGKASLVRKLSEIVTKVYATKPHLVLKYTVPVAFFLLNESQPDIRAAVTDLVKMLKGLLGMDFLDFGDNLTRCGKDRLIEIFNE